MGGLSEDEIASVVCRSELVSQRPHATPTAFEPRHSIRHTSQRHPSPPVVPTIHSPTARETRFTHRIRNPRHFTIACRGPGAAAAVRWQVQLGEGRLCSAGAFGPRFHCLRLSAMTVIAVMAAWLRLA